MSRYTGIHTAHDKLRFIYIQSFHQVMGEDGYYIEKYAESSKLLSNPPIIHGLNQSRKRIMVGMSFSVL